MAYLKWIFLLSLIHISEPTRRTPISYAVFCLKKKQKVLVRFSGPNNLAVEDFLPFEGESEWVEVDSTPITFFIADHQDQFDTLEIIDDLAEA